jgi:peroxiredoxin
MPMIWLYQSVQLGRFSAPIWLLASLAGLAGTYVAIRVLFHHEKPARTAVFDLVFNTFFIFFLVWKLSPAVFQFSQILKQPSALLYLPGGTGGGIAGAGGAIIYLTIKFLRIRPVKRRIVRGLVISTVVFASVFFVAGSLAGLPQRSSQVQAPDFQLTSLDSDLYQLSDFKGKYVILNFWASWCGPCRAEIPELVEFYENLNEDKVVLLGINQTATEAGTGVVSEFAEQRNMRFPILLDSGNRVYQLYGIRGIPTTVIVDPDGVIAAKRTGAVTGTWLKTVLR